MLLPRRVCSVASDRALDKQVSFDDHLRGLKGLAVGQQLQCSSFAKSVLQSISYILRSANAAGRRLSLHSALEATAERLRAISNGLRASGCLKHLDDHAVALCERDRRALLSWSLHEPYLEALGLRLQADMKLQVSRPSPCFRCTSLHAPSSSEACQAISGDALHSPIQYL